MIRFPLDRQKCRDLWTTSLTNEELAKELGINPVQLYVAGRKLGLGQRWEYINRKYTPREDPSEDEIKARAAEIRAGWSEEEREARLVGSRAGKTWRPPAFEFRQGIAIRSQ